MIFSISYSELSKIISSVKQRTISIKPTGNNSFSVHTTQSLLITNVAIDWFFTYINLSNNIITMNVTTSGMFSNIGINSVLGSQKGIKHTNGVLTIDVSELLPQNLKDINVKSLAITNIGIDIELSV